MPKPLKSPKPKPKPLKMPNRKKRKNKKKERPPGDAPMPSLRARLCAAEGDVPCEDLGVFRCGRRPLGCARTLRGCKATGMCERKTRTSSKTVADAPSCRRMLAAALNAKDHALIAEVRLACNEELAAGGRLAKIVDGLRQKGMLVAGKGAVIAAKVAPVLARLAVKIAAKVATYASATTLEILKHLFTFAFENPNCFTRAFAAIACRNGNKKVRGIGGHRSREPTTIIDASLRALCALFDWVVCAIKDHVLARLPIAGAFIGAQLVTTSGASCKTFVASNKFHAGMRGVYALVKRKGTNQIVQDVGAVYAKFGVAAKAIGAVGAVGAVGTAGVTVPAAAVLALGAAAANFTFSIGKEVAEDFVENPYGCPAKAWKELFLKIGQALANGGSPRAQLKQVELKILSRGQQRQITEAGEGKLTKSKPVLRLRAPP